MAYRSRRRSSSRRRSGAGVRTQWVRARGLLTATNATEHLNLLGTLVSQTPSLGISQLELDEEISPPEDTRIERVFLQLEWLDSNNSQSTFIGLTVGPTQVGGPTAASIPGPSAAANSGDWMLWDYLGPTPIGGGYQVGGGATGSENTTSFHGQRRYDVKSRRLIRKPFHSLWLVAEPATVGQGATLLVHSSTLLRIP